MDTGSHAFGGQQRSYSFPRFHADAIPFSATAVQCPNVECEQVDLQNPTGNTGNVTIGSSRLADTGTGWVLAPGESTGWIPINNLNLIWHKDAAGGSLNYKVFW